MVRAMTEKEQQEPSIPKVDSTKNYEEMMELARELATSENDKTRDLVRLIGYLAIDTQSRFMEIAERYSDNDSDILRVLRDHLKAQGEVDRADLAYLEKLNGRVTELEKKPVVVSSELEDIRSKLQKQEAQFEEHQETFKTLNALEAFSQSQLSKWFGKTFGKPEDGPND
jgi:hypothetical protein